MESVKDKEEDQANSVVPKLGGEGHFVLEQDEESSGGDSNEGPEEDPLLAETVVWRDKAFNNIEEIAKIDLAKGENVHDSENIEKQMQIQMMTNAEASEIVMHDHNFTRKYKPPSKSTEKITFSVSDISKTQKSVQEVLDLGPLTSGANKYPSTSTIAHEQQIPNVILTTMDGKPFHLEPGSQILQLVNSFSTSDTNKSPPPIMATINDSNQQIEYQLVNLSATSNAELNNDEYCEQILEAPQTLPTINLLTNNIIRQSTNLNAINGVLGANETKEKSTSVDSQQNVISTAAPIILNAASLIKGQGGIVNGNVQGQRFIFLAGLCRVCLLRKDHLINVFEDVNIGKNGLIENTRGPHAASRYSIISALKTLLDVDVFYGDGMPGDVCVDCVDNLLSFSVFRKKISIGQLKLSDIIAQVQGTPNITLINDMGEKDIRKTDVFRHPDSIIKAKDLIKSSSFSHCAIRCLPDRILDKMFIAMSTMVGFKSGKLKELEAFAIDLPHVTAWYCYTCNLTIHGSHEVYAQHYVEVHEISDAEDVLFPCDICGSSFSLSDCTGMSQNYAEHWLQHFFFHICSICFKKMPSMKGMWVHKRSAHSSTDKIYQCQICDKSFAKKAHLDAHGKTHLDPEERKQHLNFCKICGKGLTSSLALHMASVHSEERPWKCEICGKDFKRREILNGHRATVHYNLKKYECELCGVFLKSHSSKAMHLLRHKGEKTHACQVCEKSFYSVQALRSHMIRHNDVGENQCTVCSKIFKRKLYLTEHMRLHTGEKPHECHICGKHIRMKSNYYKHMKIHSRRNFEGSNETMTVNIDLTQDIDT